MAARLRAVWLAEGPPRRQAAIKQAGEAASSVGSVALLERIGRGFEPGASHSSSFQRNHRRLIGLWLPGWIGDERRGSVKERRGEARRGEQSAAHVSGRAAAADSELAFLLLHTYIHTYVRMYRQRAGLP